MDPDHRRPPGLHPGRDFVVVLEPCLVERSREGRTRTREVGGVSENVKLNRALWTLADEFAKLKQNQI